MYYLAIFHLHTTMKIEVIGNIELWKRWLGYWKNHSYRIFL
jgi:hypothetical protein